MDFAYVRWISWQITNVNIHGNAPTFFWGRFFMSLSSSSNNNFSWYNFFVNFGFHIHLM
jgi:hypothetical protein